MNERPPSEGTLSSSGPAEGEGARATCPPWCTTSHGVAIGEEDWLHVSEPLLLAQDVLARLCLSVDPATHTKDGPYVVVGGSEYTLDEAGALGASLMTLANLGATPTDRAATGTRFPCP